MRIFIILNDTDKPHPRNIVEVIVGKCFYIHPDNTFQKSLGRIEDWPNHTLLRDFGVFPVEDLHGGLMFKKTKPSTARYTDGGHRDWQGPQKFIVGWKCGVEMMNNTNKCRVRPYLINAGLSVPLTRYEGDEERTFYFKGGGPVEYRWVNEGTDHERFEVLVNGVWYDAYSIDFDFEVK